MHVSILLSCPDHRVTAVPHMSTADDEYDGYFIPKGTVVLGNSWSVPLGCSPVYDILTIREGQYCTILSSIPILWNSNQNVS